MAPEQKEEAINAVHKLLIADARSRKNFFSTGLAIASRVEDIGYKRQPYNTDEVKLSGLLISKLYYLFLLILSVTIVLVLFNALAKPGNPYNLLFPTALAVYLIPKFLKEFWNALTVNMVINKKGILFHNDFVSWEDTLECFIIEYKLNNGTRNFNYNKYYGLVIVTNNYSFIEYNLKGLNEDVVSHYVHYYLHLSR